MHPEAAVALAGESPRPARKLRLIGVSAAFAGNNFVSLALRLIGGILVARTVEPSVLGLFNSLALVLGYLPFLQLGVLNGLNRELPYQLGAGRRDSALQLAAAAQGWALATGCVSVAGLSALSAFHLYRGNWYLAIGWFTNALGGMAYFYSTYLQMTFRTSGEFARLGVANVVQNTVAVASVLAVSLWGFVGLCFRSVASNGAQLAMLCRWKPIAVRPRWSPAHIRLLIRTGLPIFAVGQVYAWWSVLDSTLVLKFLGTRAVGLYALAVLTTSALQILPLSVAQVVYPKMAEQYGAKADALQLLRTAMLPTLAAVAVMFPVLVATWHLLPELVVRVVPNYREGIAAAQWATAAATVMAASPPLAIFNVVRRQDLYSVALGCGVLAYLASLWALGREGWHLEVFPQAMLVGNAVFILGSYLLFWPLVRQVRQDRDRTVTPPRGFDHA